jgi:hypothetical protein
MRPGTCAPDDITSLTMSRLPELSPAEATPQVRSALERLPPLAIFRVAGILHKPGTRGR